MPAVKLMRYCWSKNSSRVIFLLGGLEAFVVDSSARMAAVVLNTARPVVEVADGAGVKLASACRSW